MQPSFYRLLNRLFTRHAFLTRHAYGTCLAVTALSVVSSLPVVFSLCLLSTLPFLNAEPAQQKPSVQEKSSVPAGVQAPPFTPNKLPYRLTWGATVVVAEVAHGKDSDDGDQQVRIVDASGHLLRHIKADLVEDVRLVKPLVAGEQGLLIATTGGNSGRGDYYGFGKSVFGKGIANRFHVSDATQVDVKDLNGDGTAEIIAVYRLEDIDGGGEHHGAYVTVVYQWNGTKYVEATRSFPALTRAREKEDQAALAAIEAKASQSSASQGYAASGASDPEIDGHFNAAVGYLMNAMIAGDGTEAKAWLKDNVSADRFHMSSDMRKLVLEPVDSMLSPLAQDAGDGSQASTPAPTQAALNMAQSLQRAGIVPGQSLGIVKIGAVRADVIAAIKMRPTANYDLKHGLVEDDWSGHSADESGEGYSASVWYRQGKVVQAQTTLTETQRANIPSFNALIARDPRLKEVCYYMGYYDSSGPAGGADFYCFDDVKRGIAYMTDKPGTLIIHAAGIPYIPFQGQTNVTRVTGAGSMLYQNPAEQDRAYAMEKKIKASHAGARKKL